MRHDTAALVVAEAVNQSSHWPLYNRRHRERQEPQGRPHHLAPARIAVGSTFDADRNADSDSHSPVLVTGARRSITKKKKKKKYKKMDY